MSSRRPRLARAIGAAAPTAEDVDGKVDRARVCSRGEGVSCCRAPSSAPVIVAAIVILVAAAAIGARAVAFTPPGGAPARADAGAQASWMRWAAGPAASCPPPPPPPPPVLLAPPLPPPPDCPRCPPPPPSSSPLPSLTPEPTPCAACAALEQARRDIAAPLADVPSGAGRAAAFVGAYVGKKRAMLRAVRVLRALTMQLRDALEASVVAGATDLLTSRLPLPDAPHEDDAVLPEPSTHNCYMQGDAFDVCVAENICVDVPGPFSVDRWDKPADVLFVGSGSGVGDASDADDTAAARAARHRRRDSPRPGDRRWNASALIPRPQIEDAFDTASTPTSPMGVEQGGRGGVPRGRHRCGLLTCFTPISPLGLCNGDAPRVHRHPYAPLDC